MFYIPLIINRETLLTESLGIIYNKFELQIKRCEGLVKVVTDLQGEAVKLAFDKVWIKIR